MIINKIKQILQSIQTVEDYIKEKKIRGQEHDRRINRLYRATMNGEQDWFLDLVKKNPNCVADVVKECKLNDNESS